PEFSAPINEDAEEVIRLISNDQLMEITMAPPEAQESFGPENDEAEISSEFEIVKNSNDFPENILNENDPNSIELVPQEPNPKPFIDETFFSFEDPMADFSGPFSDPFPTSLGDSAVLDPAPVPESIPKDLAPAPPLETLVAPAPVSLEDPSPIPTVSTFSPDLSLDELTINAPATASPVFSFNRRPTTKVFDSAPTTGLASQFSPDLAALEFEGLADMIADDHIDGGVVIDEKPDKSRPNIKLNDLESFFVADDPHEFGSFIDEIGVDAFDSEIVKEEKPDKSGPKIKFNDLESFFVADDPQAIKFGIFEENKDEKNSFGSVKKNADEVDKFSADMAGFGHKDHSEVEVSSVSHPNIPSRPGRPKQGRPSRPRNPTTSAPIRAVVTTSATQAVPPPPAVVTRKPSRRIRPRPTTTIRTTTTTATTTTAKITKSRPVLRTPTRAPIRSRPRPNQVIRKTPAPAVPVPSMINDNIQENIPKSVSNRNRVRPGVSSPQSTTDFQKVSQAVKPGTFDSIDQGAPPRRRPATAQPVRPQHPQTADSIDQGAPPRRRPATAQSVRPQHPQTAEVLKDSFDFEIHDDAHIGPKSTRPPSPVKRPVSSQYNPTRRPHGNRERRPPPSQSLKQTTTPTAAPTAAPSRAPFTPPTKAPAPPPLASKPVNSHFGVLQPRPGPAKYPQHEPNFDLEIIPELRPQPAPRPRPTYNNPRPSSHINRPRHTTQQPHSHTHHKLFYPTQKPTIFKVIDATPSLALSGYGNRPKTTSKPVTKITPPPSSKPNPPPQYVKNRPHQTYRPTQAPSTTFDSQPISNYKPSHPRPTSRPNYNPGQPPSSHYYFGTPRPTGYQQSTFNNPSSYSPSPYKQPPYKPELRPPPPPPPAAELAHPPATYHTPSYSPPSNNAPSYQTSFTSTPYTPPLPTYNPYSVKPVLAPISVSVVQTALHLPDPPGGPYPVWDVNAPYTQPQSPYVTPSRAPRQRLQVPEHVVSLLHAPQPDWVDSLEPYKR
ncbi:unnamed protein product, partial [Meganyctiphanes norvegica]